MGYLTFNTRSNGVVIISSVATKIFLSMCNTGTVTFQPISIKTIVNYFFCAYCVCASYIRYHYLLFIYLCLLFVIVVHLFCSLFDSCLFYFLISFVVHCFKEKSSILILNCVQVFRSRCSSTPHYLYESINIIQADSTDFVLVSE
jgi:hypothetical protein